MFMTGPQEIIELEKRLDAILPDGWQDKFETHEDLAELFERSFDKAEAISRRAIELLKNYYLAVKEQHDLARAWPDKPIGSVERERFIDDFWELIDKYHLSYRELK